MKNENSNYKNIILFFLIALIWSDGIWILLNPKIQHLLSINISLTWAWLGLIGPGLSAIIVSFIENGLTGWKKLFTPLLRWRVPIIYYILIYLGVTIFYISASWLSVLTYGADNVKDFSWLLANVKSPIFELKGIWVIIEITIIYTFCEELGWRGYALPKMNYHFTGISAAIIIGFLWTLWHIPLIYLYGSSLNISSTIIYFLHIECMSIFYAWLYFKTNKSLLLMGLFHGATDGIGSFFPATNSTIGQGPNEATLILELIIAAIMIPYLWRIKSIQQCQIGAKPHRI